MMLMQSQRTASDQYVEEWKNAWCTRHDAKVSPLTLSGVAVVEASLLSETALSALPVADTSPPVLLLLLCLSLLLPVWDWAALLLVRSAALLPEAALLWMMSLLAVLFVVVVTAVRPWLAEALRPVPLDTPDVLAALAYKEVLVCQMFIRSLPLKHGETISVHKCQAYCRCSLHVQ